MASNSDPWVLGISASHNGAVCLLRGDEIVVAVQEERLTRVKRQKIFGAQESLAMNYCLDYAGIKPRDLSMVVISALERARSPLNDLKANQFLQVEHNRIPTLVIPHHYAHAVSVFATSGFENAAVLVADGAGSPTEDLFEDEIKTIKGPARQGWEWVSLYSAKGTTITPLEKHLLDGFRELFSGTGMYRFRSLGLIFNAVAAQVFNDPFDAGKVMGLAPYGRPSIPADQFFEIRDGQFIFHDKIQALFQHRERWPQRQQEYQDLACSTQNALEVALLYLVEHLHELYPSENFCYAGGVALNSIANERIIRESAFKNVFIAPAAEDSGPALGAAYHGLWQLTKTNTRRRMAHDALGRPYPREVVAQAIAETPAVEVVATSNVVETAVDLLCAGHNLGWFQGRSELGPRALGQRSIICDPRRPEAKQELNSKVKHREEFRPFAPVVLLEEAAQWFEWDDVTPESPYMLRIAKFREEKQALVPAVVHVDGTGRVQTLTREANGEFYELVARFGERTGVPIILNTSFNVMGMPIVETPFDALQCLLATGLDYCVLGETLVKKRRKILLGLDTSVPAEPLNERAEQPQRQSERRANTQGPYPLEDYVGTYQQGVGTLNIHQHEGQLKATFIGMTTALKHDNGHSFLALDKPFTGSLFTFIINRDGDIGDVSVVVGPEMGEAGEIMLWRVFESGPDGERSFDKYVGDYEVAGETVRVMLLDNVKLAVTATEQPLYELVKGHGDRFNLKNTPGYSIEFKVNGSGAASEAIIKQPNGAFRLRRK